MFYIKSDDIEELFREAAEKYHIDTEAAAAWDDVRDAVHANDQATPPSPPDDKKRRRWFSLAWLLLIPLGWYAHNVWNDIRGPKNTHKQVVQAPAANNPANSAQPQQSNPAGNTAAGAQKPADNTANSIAGTASAADNNNATTEKPPHKSTSSLGVKTGKANIARATQTAGRNMATSQPITARAQQEKKNDDGHYDVVVPVDDASKKNEAVANLVPGANAAGNQQPASAQPVDNSSVAAINETAKTVDSTQANTNPLAKKEKKPKEKSGHYFYTGLIVAPDVSFIHFQKTSPVGIGGGILVGYQVNKRLSVEAGVLFDRKNYYTNSKYFDKSKIPFFANNPGAMLNTVDGNCNMFEIPVNLKYSFLLKNKNSMYAIAGLSSYLMGHEYYEFDYTQWGADYTGGRPYDNGNKSWFSIINLGLGYERKLGPKTSMRIEPYIKIPVSGAGTGNIKITSTGLYLGVTRRIP